MSRDRSPRKISTELGLSILLAICCWNPAMAQTKLCEQAECPEAVSIPKVVGLQNVCGAGIAEGEDRYTEAIAAEIPGKYIQDNTYGNFLGVNLKKDGETWTSEEFLDWLYSDFSFDNLPEDPFQRRLEDFDVNIGKRFRPGVFEITRIQGARRREGNGEWIGGGYYYWERRWIDYTVTCDNGITYKDQFYWEVRDDDCDIYVINNCSKPENVAEEIPLSEFDRGAMKVAGVEIPEGLLASKWVARNVGLPPYAGGAEKLPTPVVLINGLGFDYRVWGIEPLGPKGSAEWNAGLVKDYHTGSLPDVLSRAYGLKKGAEINQNGVFFLSIDPLTLIGRSFDQVRLQYISWFENTLRGYFGGTPRKDQMIDVVCHGTGCLALRTLIFAENQAFNMADPVVDPNENPFNHIRKIVSVNAPHQGSALAKSLSDIQNDANLAGLSSLVEELAENDKAVFDASFRLDFSEIAWENSEGLATLLFWGNATTADFWVEAKDVGTKIKNWWTGSNDNDDWDLVKVKLRGGLFGPHRAEIWGKSVPATDDLVPYRENIIDYRTIAGLAQGAWERLPQELHDYSRYSTGAYIPFVPFYSDKVQTVEAELVSHLGKEGLRALCVGIIEPGCFDIEQRASYQIKKELNKIINGLGTDANFDIAPWLLDLVRDLREGWMANSDLLVERSSQIWGLENGGWDENDQRISELHPAQTYSLHYANYPGGHPRRTVLHAPMYFLGDAVPADLEFPQRGATLMGRDLFCAIDPSCAKAVTMAMGEGNSFEPLFLGKAQQVPVSGPEGVPATSYGQTLSLTGDFSVSPLNLSPGFSGISVDQGEYKLTIAYHPSIGTYKWIQGPWSSSGEVLLPPSFRPQFTLSRKDRVIEMLLTTQNGSSMKENTYLLNLVALTSLKITVLGDGLATEPAVLLGKATPTDPETQHPVVKYESIQPLVREACFQDPLASCPTIWVGNSGTEIVQDLTLHYYFSADPQNNPVVQQVAGPSARHELVFLGGEQWLIRFRVESVPAQGFFPGESGIQFRLSNLNAAPWIKEDDYSRGFLTPMSHDHVPIYDAQNRLIWGFEPSEKWKQLQEQEQEDPHRIAVSFKDNGTGENNLVRPRIQIWNRDEQPLAGGYQVLLYVDHWGVQPENPILEDWYSPHCEGTIQKYGDRFVEVSWTFHEPLMPGEKIGLGEWGIHWPDWRVIDKSGLDPAQIVVLDAQGAVLFGQRPPLESPPGQETTETGLQWMDGGAHEFNMFRPRLELAHIAGPTLDAGFTVRAQIEGIASGGSFPVLEDYYSPDCSASLSVLDANTLELIWTFQQPLFAGHPLNIGDWGLHWPDWRAMDKSGVAAAKVVVMDNQGREIYRNYP